MMRLASWLAARDETRGIGLAKPVSRSADDPCADRFAPGPETSLSEPRLARPALPLAGPGGTATAPRLGSKTGATGDEDEMEGLDIQRRKAHGLPDHEGDAARKQQPGAEQPRGERR